MQLARYPSSSPRRSAAGPDQAPGPAPAPGPRGPRRSIAAPDTELIGLPIIDRRGRGVGRVEGTLQPEWLIVGDRGAVRVLVPSAGLEVDSAGLHVPLSAEQILGGPAVEPAAGIAAEQIEAAREYYREA